MKILVLNGSPHKDGNTAFLVNAFKEGAESVGHEVSVINVCEKKIAGCIACEGCHETGVCVQQDDMHEIHKHINEDDMLVFASPIYYHHFSGQLQCAITRIYPYAHKLGNIEKTAMILSSGEDGVYGPAIESYRLNFEEYLGIENAGIFTAYGEQNKSPEKYEELKAFGTSL